MSLPRRYRGARGVTFETHGTVVLYSPIVPGCALRPPRAAPVRDCDRVFSAGVPVAHPIRLSPDSRALETSGQTPRATFNRLEFWNAAAPGHLMKTVRQIANLQHTGTGFIGNAYLLRFYGPIKVQTHTNLGRGLCTVVVIATQVPLRTNGPYRAYRGCAATYSIQYGVRQPKICGRPVLRHLGYWRVVSACTRMCAHSQAAGQVNAARWSLH